MDEAADPHLLTMTVYPRGLGRFYEGWEVTAPTGEVLVSGTTFPVDQDAVREACAAYHKRIDKASEPDVGAARPPNGSVASMTAPKPEYGKK